TTWLPTTRDPTVARFDDTEGSQLSTRRPNVLFILTDQQRADSVGSVNGWSRTPNLDALRGEAAMFSTCITTAPVCIPARFSLATGFYPHNLGTQKNGAFT